MGDCGEEKMASTGKDNRQGGVNVLWIKGGAEAHGAIQQRVGQTDANHFKCTEQWSQWSDVNLQEVLCVPGKCFGKSPLLCWYHGILSTKEQIIHTVSNTTEKLITVSESWRGSIKEAAPFSLKDVIER